MEESKELLIFAAETFQIIAIMTAIQLRAELFREMNPMLENEAYQVIEVDPEIKKWSGCTSFSADEIESDPRLKAILSR